MDLSRLSLRELLREARRLGISMPDELSRDGLVNAIRRMMSAARSAFPPARSPSVPPPASEPGSSGEAPTTSRVGGEPIQTRTMARLLAEQGHARRALAMYDELLERSPHDAELRGERDRLAEQGDVSPDPTADDGEANEVAAVAVDAERVLVSWNVSPQAIERAARLLPGPGALVARLMVFAPDEGTVVRSETRERRDVPSSGQWVVAGLPAESRATASVGLMRDDRFVSIAHAAPIRPASSPASPPAP